jgi:hypothetical protein
MRLTFSLKKKGPVGPLDFLSSRFIAEPVLAQTAFFAARARAIPLSEVGFAPAARVAACCLVAGCCHGYFGKRP